MDGGNHTVQSTLNALQSDKVKERTSALQRLRITFSNDQAVYKYGTLLVVHSDDRKAAPERWKDIYSALFIAFKKEKETLVTQAKSKRTQELASTPAYRRLEEVANTIRWMTERCAEYLDSQVMNYLLWEMSTNIVQGDRLLAPAALDFFKAAKQLVIQSTYMEHWEPLNWETYVQHCFNVLLGDSIKTELTANVFGEEADDNDEVPATPQRRNGGRLQRALVTKEQLICGDLLASLLQSQTHPLIHAFQNGGPPIAFLVFSRLKRLLYKYPSESSLLQDFLRIVVAALDQLALNDIHHTRSFARDTWETFVGLWGLKDKRMKEQLLVILRNLFPFIVAGHPVFEGKEGEIPISDCLRSLYSALSKEAEGRWGSTMLNLSALRLEIRGGTGIVDGKDSNPFVSNTFRSDLNFDTDQAMSWAILDLHANCTHEIHRHENSIPAAPKSKKMRMQPILQQLLDSISSQTSSQSRCYHLRVLLFLVDRHWITFAEEYKLQIISTLTHLASVDDFESQSWAFLNIAAVALAEKKFARQYAEQLSSSQAPVTIDAATWDTLLSYAIRRAAVPQVCRAACHAAHAIIIAFYRFTPPSGHIFLSSSKVLLEVESFGKDLDIQGPHAPYDSVCMFLTQCLSIASQDTRLYRMQLEEKVLVWLMDNWVITGTESNFVTHHPTNDLLALLMTISGFSKHCDLLVRLSLPVCSIADSMKMERRLQPIRGFLLNARIATPVTERHATSKREILVNTIVAPEPTPTPLLDTQVPGRGRERRISLFLLRMLDALMLEWQSRLKDGPHPTVEIARRTLDFAVIAMAFECMVSVNNVSPTKRVLQSAGKIVASVFTVSQSPRWSLEEKVVLVSRLEAIVWTTRYLEDQPWETLVQPNYAQDGIDRRARELDPDLPDPNDQLRGAVLRTLWKNYDLHGPLQEVCKTARADIERPINALTAGEDPMDADDRDSFGHNAQSSDAERTAEKTHLMQRLFDVHFTLLVRGALLQTLSGEPTRERALIGNICATGETKKVRWFLMVLPIILREIEMGNLECKVPQLYDLLIGLGRHSLTEYSYNKSPQVQVLAVKLFSATMGVWVNQELPQTEGDFLEKLCKWMVKALTKGAFPAWQTRDAFATFMQKYLLADPTCTSWPQHHEHSPRQVLELFCTDEDIRVRFRTAVTLPHLFATSVPNQEELYAALYRHIPTRVNEYEHMITRLLSLGNIMVVSSTARRGPYWNILETHRADSRYDPQIVAVLEAVVDRLGLPSLASLFSAYAHHLATGMVCKKGDFIAFPFHVFGYSNQTECMAASFRVFAPTYLALRATRAFTAHCDAFEPKKNPAQGLEECYGDAIGFFCSLAIDDNANTDLVAMESELQDLVDGVARRPQDLSSVFKKHANEVISSMLRKLGDQNCSADGPIVSGMQTSGVDGKAIQVFLVLTKYRSQQTFVPHTPNKPVFATSVVLRSLFWFFKRVPDALNAAVVYHVIHSLFASIHETPLINEKFRLLNGICLWIAYRHSEFNDPTLLHAVLHGAASLVSDPSLARAAQSILEWTFRCYKKLRTADSRLSRILIRISSMCHEFATQSYNQELRVIGESLMAWIDSQAAILASEEILLPMVHKALAAWPYDSAGELASIQQSVTLKDVNAILQDDHITSGKFRVVRRLQDDDFLNNINFARRAFWRLKESLPEIDRLQQDDITAFADILIANHGQIDSVNSQQLVLDTVRNRHRRLTNKEVHGGTGGGSNMLLIARESIIYGLLGLLESESPALVHKAFTTLRLMMGSMPQTTAKPSFWAVEYRKEVEFLQSYPLSPSTQHPRELETLLLDHMCVEKSSKFSLWIREITQFISSVLSYRDAALGQLSSIIQGEATVAEEMLPVLVFILLHAEQLAATPGTRDKEILSRFFTKVLEHPNASSSTLRSIVEVVLHLRNLTPRVHDPLAYNKWLDLDYNLLAQSAVKCGAYTTALLFLELAPDVTGHSSLAAGIAEQIQYEIYAHIDEPDGFYGIMTTDLQHFLLERFKHEQQWDKAFSFYGAALEAQGGRFEPGTSDGLIQSFHSFGFDHLAMSTLQTSNSAATGNKSTSAALDYNLGWRSETWDLPDSDSYSLGAPLYHVLRCVHRERGLKAVEACTQAALYREMQQLRSLGAESVTQTREVLKALMCLNQVVQWKSERLQTDLRDKRIDFEKWQSISMISTDFGFTDLESIMSVRISLIRSSRQREERQQIGNLQSSFLSDLVKLEKQCLLSLAEAARESGQTQIALNSVMRAQRLETVPSFETSQEYANVLWALKEEKIAVNFLEDLTKRPTFASIPPPAKASLYAKLGTWISAAFLQKPTDVWQKYFSTAIHELQTWGPNQQHDVAAVYHQCAVFADRQYHAIVKSPDAVRWKVYVERKQKEIADREIELTELIARGDAVRQHEVQRAQGEAQKLLNADKDLHEKHNKTRVEFLRQSLQMYARCLQFTDEYDTEASIKFSSLWFANFDDQESVATTIHHILDRIPSRKFIFLAHQLSARLTNAAESSQSQQDLQQLMLRLCREHPFHSFYQIYCLQADQPVTESRQSRQSMSHVPSHHGSQSQRRDAAEGVLAQLQEDSHVGMMIQDMKKLCEAYLQWAKYPITPKKKQYTKSGSNPGPWDIPSRLKIRHISRELQTKIPVLTAETKIDPTMKYADCIWLSRYDEKFETAGGINMPKVTVCLGEDGTKYKQLFKGEGKDDLRQDAVMEQVFDLVNNILKEDRETQRRTLRIRSYKVVPLGTQAGVLEFVTNTAPLREWLQKGHPRYRKNDMSPSDASKQLNSVHSKPPDERLRMYLKVIARFKPVFRHFFTEKARNPTVWFALRLHYVRSVATSSIVGHILGLGDRHTSNILMDTVTGELVHIDLGIAFDQGKLLAIPETVPFRLTRDIVDGMGIAGTQGVFQRCSEETLRVLRDSSDIIMTVLEVFKYDPLHSWTLSEIKIRRAQMVKDETSDASTSALVANRLDLLTGIGIDMTSGTAQEAADRALSSVARKLDKSLSVESTVNELIAEATDVGNLGKIFCGWAPHM